MAYSSGKMEYRPAKRSTYSCKTASCSSSDLPSGVSMDSRLRGKRRSCKHSPPGSGQRTVMAWVSGERCLGPDLGSGDWVVDVMYVLLQRVLAEGFAGQPVAGGRRSRSARPGGLGMVQESSEGVDGLLLFLGCHVMHLDALDNNVR